MSRPTERAARSRVRKRVARPLVIAVAGCCSIVLATTSTVATAASPLTQVVSIGNYEQRARQHSDFPQVSRDGRYVAFSSLSGNFTSGDTNRVDDVFVRDRVAGTTQRITRGYDGSPANGPSDTVSMSADSRFVAFTSYASNLVRGDTNGVSDSFLWDRTTGSIERVSLTDAGLQRDGFAEWPSVSDDGRFVAWYSFESDLDEGQIFVRDRQLGTTRMVSVTSAGVPGDGTSWLPLVSGDGRYVAFSTYANNLVGSPASDFGSHVAVHNLVTGSTRRVDVFAGPPGQNFTGEATDISRTGRFIGFYASDGDTAQAFVRDMSAPRAEVVSLSSNGTQADNSDDPAMWGPFVSDNGRYVTFVTTASNLVAGDTNGVDDVFWRDRQEGVTRRVSVATSGQQANDRSHRTVISGSGRWVAFSSVATNLVGGDVNGRRDIFLRRVF